MNTELEIKFLDIDKEELRKKLRDLGCVLVEKERLMKRKIFDYPDWRLRKQGAWIRVRDEGNKITLSYKRLVDRTLHGIKEIEVIINDFEAICDFLLASGFDMKSYQENKRESWKYKDVEIDIDTWPWIPSFVEIEVNDGNEKNLRDFVDKFGFKWEDGLYGNVETPYQKYFDVTEEEIYSWEEILFIEVPDWLEIKRKKGSGTFSSEVRNR